MVLMKRIYFVSIVCLIIAGVVALENSDRHAVVGVEARHSLRRHRRHLEHDEKDAHERRQNPMDRRDRPRRLGRSSKCRRTSESSRV